MDYMQIKYDKLPIRIFFSQKNGAQKEYILKTNNDGTKILLNKKEY